MKVLCCVYNVCKPDWKCFRNTKKILLSECLYVNRVIRLIRHFYGDEQAWLVLAIKKFKNLCNIDKHLCKKSNWKIKLPSLTHIFHPSYCLLLACIISSVYCNNNRSIHSFQFTSQKISQNLSSTTQFMKNTKKLIQLHIYGSIYISGMFIFILYHRIFVWAQTWKPII